MLGLLTLALLGSTVVAAMATVLELECLASALATVMPTATTLSVSCLLFSFDIRIQKVLCQVVLVDIIDTSNCVWKDDENHPFIIPLIKKIREMK